MAWTPPEAEVCEAKEEGDRLKAEGVWLLQKGNQCSAAGEKLKYYGQARDAFIRARACLPGDRSITLQIDKIELGILDFTRRARGKGGTGEPGAGRTDS